MPSLVFDVISFYSNHSEYKRHLRTLFSIEGRVDHKMPESKKFTHLRPRNYNRQQYAKRESKIENDHLVIKILKLRGRQSGGLIPTSGLRSNGGASLSPRQSLSASQFGSPGTKPRSRSSQKKRWSSLDF